MPLYNSLIPSKPQLVPFFFFSFLFFSFLFFSFLFFSFLPFLNQTYIIPFFSLCVCVCVAMRMLNGVVLFGKPMHITVSNKTSIKMPQPGSEDHSANFNKDFTNSEFHRFKVAGSKNYQNICPPGPTLHISNIPTPDGQKLQDLFSQYGTVVAFKFFP